MGRRATEGSGPSESAPASVGVGCEGGVVLVVGVQDGELRMELRIG